jgi:hypothetical protein
MWTTIDIFERPKRENKIKKKMKDKETTIEEWCGNNNNDVKFAEWLAENHYVLNNIQDGIHFWENEDVVSTSNKLYDWFIASKEQMKDTIVESVIEQFKQRSEVGINKYGVTLDREDFDTLQWIIEAQQEAMDLCLYLERLKKNLNGK